MDEKELKNKLDKFMNKLGVRNYGKSNWKKVGKYLENGYEKDAKPVYEKLEDKKQPSVRTDEIRFKKRIDGESYKLFIGKNSMRFKKW